MRPRVFYLIGKRTFQLRKSSFLGKMFSGKLTAAAAERNKQPIIDVLHKFVDVEKKMFALEVASGTGQHAVFFAKDFPNVSWLPTDIDPGYLTSIKAHVEDSGLQNVHNPIYLDITQPIHPTEGDLLTPQSCDLILCINMIHISPLECTLGLFESAGMLLKPDGLLVTYGPYAVNGVITPESNVRFDRSLKASDGRHGLRDINDLTRYAIENGLTLQAVTEMPANNKTLVFQKRK